MKLLPSWEKSRQLEENSIPAWLNYFNSFSIVSKAFYVDDKETQTQDHWDIILILKGDNSPVRVDVKTRSSSYYPLYQKDQMILIEVEGNTNNNNLGSSIFNSNAELWAYGWLVDNEIKSPLIFQRKKFAEWFELCMDYFDSPKNSNTSGLYETKNKLIPNIFFKSFEFAPLTNTGLEEIFNA